MRYAIRWLLCSALTLFILASAAPLAFADALVDNGEFDVNELSWSTPELVDVEWVAFDAEGSGSSGSALVTSVETRLRTAVGLSQCIVLPEGDSFDVETAIYVPSAQSEEAAVGVILSWNEGDCGGRVALEIVGNTTAHDAWELLEKTVTRPVDAGSVSLIGFIRFDAKNDPDGAFEAYFDAIRFVPEPGAGTGTLVALAALAALRRR